MSFAVLLYHEIRESGMLRRGETSPIEVRQDYDDNLPGPLFMTLESFKEQMTYLAENSFHTLTLAEIMAYYYDQMPLPEKSILLTFDDCYQSMARYAYPLLKKHGFHAVSFVVTGWLNTVSKPFDPDHSVCLTQGDLKEMADVFEYANHTDRFHKRTDEQTSAMMTAGDNELIEDLNRCNESGIIQAGDVFAYPFGLYSERNAALLRKQGFKLAFTCEKGRNDRGDDPLLLKRTVIPYFMDMETFRKITG